MTVLSDVKQLVGIEPDNEEFDIDVLAHINSGLMSLSQAGVIVAGTECDKASEWSKIITAPKFNAIRTYLGLYVRRVFDPPQTSFTTNAIKESLEEIFWRLQEQARYDDSEQ